MAKIIGGTAATSMPVPDWNQTNPNRADYIKNKPDVANALKGSASGNPIRLDDVSPLAHEMAVGLKSKNLCEDVTLNGATIAGNGKSNYIHQKLNAHFHDSDTPVTVSMKFTAKDIVFSSNGFLIFCGVSYTDGTVDYLGLVTTDNYTQGFGSFTVNKKIVRIDISQQARWTGGTITINSIQVEEGTTATAYTPFVDVSGASVQKYGKNLLAYPYKQTTKTENGITFTDNGDGTITASGTATADATFRTNKYVVKANQSYIVSGCPKGGSNSTYYINPRGFDYDKGDGRLIKPNSDFSNDMEITIKSGTTVSNLVFKPMIEFGTTATEYEPYIESTTYTADENGNVEGVTSLYPTTTLMADKSVIISAEYNKDTNKVIESLVNAIISLGGNV